MVEAGRGSGSCDCPAHTGRYGPAPDQAGQRDGPFSHPSQDGGLRSGLLRLGGKAGLDEAAAKAFA